MKILEKKSLFWDAKEIDIVKNKKYIVERILAFGDLDDFFWAIQLYGREEVADIFLDSRQLDKKSSNFWRCYFNVKPKKWGKIQSIQKQNAFWSR